MTPAQQAAVNAITASVRDLLTARWADIEDTRDESGKLKVGVNVSLIAMGKGKQSATVKIAWAKRETDEIEAIVDDPDQGKLDLEEGGEE